MTKAELIDRVLKRLPPSAGITKKEAAESVDIAFGEIARALQREKRFAYPGFGTFQVRDRKERAGRDPRTGEPTLIPAGRRVGFRPALRLRGSL